MKKWIFLIAALLSLQAHAYTGKELREDCQAAEESFAKSGRLDPRASPGAARCVGYVEGFADGYAISDFLAESVGVKLNAFCLPKTPDLSSRLVRAVLGGFDRVPPNTGVNTATLVASSLSRSFPCADSLEPKK